MTIVCNIDFKYKEYKKKSLDIDLHNKQQHIFLLRNEDS